jgi:preprotein translocase subunit SecE
VARNRKRAKDRRAEESAGLNGDDGAPDPIEHAAPDAELAEAQLALGRPELSGESRSEHDDNEVEFESEAEDAYEEYENGGGGGAGIGSREVALAGIGADRGESSAHAPARRVWIGARMVAFAQGSWRELQRVQWPDRRQVMQATGVVIGFVIVAGIFLGVSDYLAGKLMDYILK